MAERPDGEQQAAVISQAAESLAWFVDSGAVAFGDSEVVEVEVPAGSIGRLAGAVLNAWPDDTPAGDWAFQALQVPDPLIPGVLLTHLIAGGDETMDVMFSYGSLTLTGGATARPADSEGWRFQLAQIRITEDVPLRLQFEAVSMTAGELGWAAILGLWLTEVV